MTETADRETAYSQHEGTSPDERCRDEASFTRRTLASHAVFRDRREGERGKGYQDELGIDHRVRGDEYLVNPAHREHRDHGKESRDNYDEQLERASHRHRLHNVITGDELPGEVEPFRVVLRGNPADEESNSGEHAGLLCRGKS